MVKERSPRVSPPSFVVTMGVITACLLLFLLVFPPTSVAIRQGFADWWNSRIGDDGNGDDDGSPTPTPTASPSATNPPYVGTWLHIDLLSDEVQREDDDQVSITSDFRNVQVTLEAQYESLTEWQPFGSYLVDNDGAAGITLTCNNAGFWDVRASYDAVHSNEEPLTVLGLTLYQQKSDWDVNDTYTAALTGTYRTWTVSLLHRQVGVPVWTWALNSQTDGVGIIDYGVNNVVIDVSQAGTQHEIIAVLDPDSAWGQAVYELLTEGPNEMYVTADDLNAAIAAGDVVQSNILTISIGGP